MRPSMLMGGSGLPPATFVGAVTQALSGGGSLNFAGIAGLQIGDYVIAAIMSPADNGYASINQAGWTQDNYVWTPGYGYRSSVFHRQLTTLTPPTISSFNSGAVLIQAYRGASRASRKVISYDDDGNSTHVVPGFVRANDAVGVVCSIFDRDQAGSEDFTPSAGWTRRALATQNFFRMACADALARSAYVDGASMTWSSLGVGGPYAQVAQMYELRI